MDKSGGTGNSYQNLWYRQSNTASDVYGVAVTNRLLRRSDSGQHNRFICKNSSGK